MATNLWQTLFMTIRMDKFGRLLLPLKVRKLLGLKPGSELVVDATEQGITLRPRQSEGKLVRERGVLVWTGPVWDEEFDPIKADRGARDAKNRGE